MGVIKKKDGKKKKKKTQNKIHNHRVRHPYTRYQYQTLPPISITLKAYYPTPSFGESLPMHRLDN